MEPIPIIINGNEWLKGVWHEDGTITVTRRQTWWDKEEHAYQWEDVPLAMEPIDDPKDAPHLSYVHLTDSELDAEQIVWLQERVIDYFAGLYRPQMRNYQRATYLMTADAAPTVTNDICLGGTCQRHMSGDWLAEAARRKGGKIYLTRPVSKGREDDDEDRIARAEAALDKAVEDGRLPGAMPADL